MRSFLRAIVAVAFLLALRPTLTTADPGDLTLWYAQPAAKWEEALPVGSGRLGAMVFGGTGEERIQYNEDTLWTGKPRSYVRAGAREHLDEIRKLIFEGSPESVKKAEDLFRAKMISDPKRQKAYQPFADLRFTFPGHEGASGFRRELDLDTAIALTTYTVNGVKFEREVFASYPDNAIVVQVRASQPGKVSFTLKQQSPHRTATTQPSGTDTVKVVGQVIDFVPIEEPGMRFESRVRVLATGGKVSVSPDGVTTVEAADSATVLVVAATDFVNWRDISADPGARCEAYLNKLSGKDYDSLKTAHVADHQKLFSRVTIDLGRNAETAKLPTNERVNRVRKAGSPPAPSTQKNPPVPDTIKGGLDADPALAALFFQYGRYMLIGSSRPGTQAANLQGVWNELLNPPWESKYTTNINVEMNYWPAEVTNLSECHEPLFNMIDDLRVSGAITAKEQYGCRGWVLHHNTDLWRGTAPINNIDGMWPTGGAWLCHHLWEHYQYTGDTAFLEKRAYPAMKEASLFFVDFLVKDPKTGWLVTNPSHSPEQGPLNAGPAMDMQLIRALFDYTIEAAKILGVDQEKIVVESDDDDAQGKRMTVQERDLISELKLIRKQLVPDQVGKHGQLQEWKDDVDEPNNGHRHMSPLWGLYPGSQFTPQTGEKLWSGVKLLLKWRADGSTGWSYVWRIPLWARVGDGEFAYRQFQILLGRRVLPNLFDLCGPYQADGNYGATAGIAEMLMHSHSRDAQTGAYEIHLLPALPRAWPSGRVSGLQARGGFDVDIAWDNGKLKRAMIKSRLGLPFKVRVGDDVRDVKAAAGESYEIK